MTSPLLTTKLYIPSIRPELVSRPRLIERLNAGIHRKLTLISAPAGFGKTTLVSEWVQAMGKAAPPIAAMGGAAFSIERKLNRINCTNYSFNLWCNGTLFEFWGVFYN